MNAPDEKEKPDKKPDELDEIVLEYDTETGDDDVILDRRQSPRMAVTGQVICLPLGGKREIRGEMLDYSEGGLYFRAGRKLKLADIVQVTYSLDDSKKAAESFGQVVRVIKIPKGFEIAVKFLSEI